jgi:Uncharacterized conserved protein H4 (DUF2046)
MEQVTRNNLYLLMTMLYIAPQYTNEQLLQMISQLQKEKIDLESQLEKEQEFITNRLSKQLETSFRRTSNSHLSSIANPSTTAVLRRSPSHSSNPAMMDMAPPTSGVVEVLRAEVCTFLLELSGYSHTLALK